MAARTGQRLTYSPTSTRTVTASPMGDMPAIAIDYDAFEKFRRDGTLHPEHRA